MGRFRRNKKVKDVVNDGEKNSFEVEQQPEITLDLASALPSTDDFRTSLLMPKLSARFSMLREQDDPESKLGKASDDSVLFPKRASRLNLFGHNPNILTDIDEVSSIDGRVNSFISGDGGYGTDDDRSQNGSIMSRARRAEGNNLFGGRQKVYRIPTRSPVGSPTAEGGRGMGKFVYEHDLTMSAFQRLRRQEKQAMAESEDFSREDFDAKSTSSSTKRTTSSSTESGQAPDRTSTAATSFDDTPASQSQVPKSAEPQVESRPPSALSNHPRNGSVRSRRLYGQGLTQTAHNQQSSTLNRLESLSRQRSGTLEFPMNRAYSRSASNLRGRLQRLNTDSTSTSTGISRPSISPPRSTTSLRQQGSVETLSKERLSPTTASFAPPLSPPSSEGDEAMNLLTAAMNPEDHGKATAMGLFHRPATGFDEQQFSRRQLQMHQVANPPPLRQSSPPRRPLPQEPVTRPRGLSKSSCRSRAESGSSNYDSDTHNGVDYSMISSVGASPLRQGTKTFYADSTASESGDSAEERRGFDIVSQAPNAPNSTDHLETLPEVRYSDLGDLKSIEELKYIEEDSVIIDSRITDQTGSITPERPDSPTLQAFGLGFNGIRSHLRSASDMSTIYPDPSPVPTREPLSTKSTTHEASCLKPVDLFEPTVQTDARQPESSTRPFSDVSDSRASEDSSEIENRPGSSISNLSSWKEDLVHHHRRGGSTETQQEREEFAMELAERRRKVQEKLRSVTEGESRSSSPSFGRQTPDIPGVKTGNAFSLLKHKSSKLGVMQQDQKNSRMYGFNGSSTTLVSEDMFHGRDEERPSFNANRGSGPMAPSERSFRSRLPNMGRTSRDGSRERSSSRSRGASRDRSDSDASARSKSRSRYRDDLQTVKEDMIAHDKFVAPMQFDCPSTEGSDRSPSVASGRYRSASRSGTPSFQYERPFQFNQVSHPPSIIGAPPRPSPATPAYSANATPPLQEMDQSLNPNSSGGNSSQRGPGSTLLQKRSVNKKEISEPTFVSSTSNVPTIGIAAPAVPPMNPRRRRGTQSIFGALNRDSSRTESPVPTIKDEHSVFPDDEKRPRSRGRLYKTSSEGGNLIRARQEALAGPVPPVPQYPPPTIPVNGHMF
ncbi:hypothetical protein N7495_000193 [Penicillium taxi]|uniref:uncharacterized protein n=1 Tax=Penicillium taxi TaxID=168475 RepID=UPI0025457101|nr:uncharacterized protein N7495_000193 [Penicillium taxi]KAJ5907511.1 hypothetical protein N7495_000193 [Penicillium taxi]